MKVGLLLLSGGRGTRMGAPKHALGHPKGGSWGGRLVRIFETVFPKGPIQILGDPLPDRPDLPCLDDSREGPAAALRTWAAAEAEAVEVWWIVACDQVRWTPARLAAWAEARTAADPSVAHWVLAHHDDHLQTLGGWLPASLRPALAASSAQSLWALVKALPHLTVPRDGAEWEDVDTPEARDRFESES